MTALLVRLRSGDDGQAADARPFLGEDHHRAAVQVLGDNVEVGQDGGLLGRALTRQATDQHDRGTIGPSRASRVPKSVSAGGVVVSPGRACPAGQGVPPEPHSMPWSSSQPRSVAEGPAGRAAIPIWKPPAPPTWAAHSSPRSSTICSNSGGLRMSNRRPSGRRGRAAAAGLWPGGRERPGRHAARIRQVRRARAASSLDRTAGDYLSGSGAAAGPGLADRFSWQADQMSPNLLSYGKRMGPTPGVAWACASASRESAASWAVCLGFGSRAGTGLPGCDGQDVVGRRHSLAEVLFDLLEHVGHVGPGREGVPRAEAQDPDARDHHLGLLGADRFLQNPLHLLDPLLPSRCPTPATNLPPTRFCGPPRSPW